MKRVFIFSFLALAFIACSENNANTKNNQDTLAPLNSTQPTGNNPGGIKAISPDSIPQPVDTSQTNTGGTGGHNSGQH